MYKSLTSLHAINAYNYVLRDVVCKLIYVYLLSVMVTDFGLLVTELVYI